jgi:hypothetical protein
MSEHGLSINVNGLTDLTVGKMIKLSFPWVAGSTGVRREGPKYKANYLITSLKHKIQCAHNSVTGPLHIMTLRLDKPNIYKG